MLDRNRRIKSQPEKFQDMNDRFDMIITCEERVYDQVVEGNLFTSYLDSLSTSYGKPYTYVRRVTIYMTKCAVMIAPFLQRFGNQRKVGSGTSTCDKY